MARKPDEEPDLAVTEELLFAGKNLQLERFDRAETLAGRTPDFRVRRAGAVVAYCEVKSPRDHWDEWFDEQLDSAAPDQIVGGARPDPAFNRITRHVQKAATQFEAVNDKRSVPNILVFVNHADASRFADLKLTLTEMFRERGLGETRFKIDLYVWIDNKTKRVRGYLFNNTTAHVETLCVLMGLDRSKVNSLIFWGIHNR